MLDRTVSSQVYDKRTEDTETNSRYKHWVTATTEPRPMKHTSPPQAAEIHTWSAGDHKRGKWMFTEAFMVPTPAFRLD